ncbi:MAG: YibE/F family protein [Solirubrobacterales bacterium]
MSWQNTSRAVNVLVALLCVVTVVGMVLLWPSGESESKLEGSLRLDTTVASVVAVEKAPCVFEGASGCIVARATLDAGPDREVELRLGGAANDPTLSVGDKIRVSASGGGDYAFVDFERRQPIFLLALIFAAIVIAFGRLRGLRALVGLAASLSIVLFFIVPAILDGREPFAVAIVGSFAVMIVTLGLTHGIGLTSRAAALGTASSLLITAILAWIFTSAGNITGFSSDEATILQSASADLSIGGLVLAGIIIAALGVLDDLTVSQASAVMAIRNADPMQGFKRLYDGAINVGRDHVAATVNTLVLAYVGASLPVLLIFSVGGVGPIDALNSEAVAEQIVGTLVGSIGLIAAVPITTAIAAALASRLPGDIQVEAGPTHSH